MNILKNSKLIEVNKTELGNILDIYIPFVFIKKDILTKYIELNKDLKNYSSTILDYFLCTFESYDDYLIVKNKYFNFHEYSISFKLDYLELNKFSTDVFSYDVILNISLDDSDVLIPIFYPVDIKFAPSKFYYIDGKIYLNYISYLIKTFALYKLVLNLNDCMRILNDIQPGIINFMQTSFYKGILVSDYTINLLYNVIENFIEYADFYKIDNFDDENFFYKIIIKHNYFLNVSYLTDVIRCDIYDEIFFLKSSDFKKVDILDLIKNKKDVKVDMFFNKTFSIFCKNVLPFNNVFLEIKFPEEKIECFIDILGYDDFFKNRFKYTVFHNLLYIPFLFILIYEYKKYKGVLYEEPII